MKTSIAFVTTAVSFAALAGCAHESKTTLGSPQTTNANVEAPISNQSAVGEITSARCTREEKCNNIGQGKKFADRASCEREVHQNTMSDLRESECAGVVRKELDECLDEVKNQACGNPIDAIARLTACTRGQLCR